MHTFTDKVGPRDQLLTYNRKVRGLSLGWDTDSPDRDFSSLLQPLPA
jgi:hypothetical protein